jgi:predicted RNase H-like nuclease (RuvC/YqgF family)
MIIKLKLNKTRYPKEVEITKLLDMIKNRGHEIITVDNKKEFKKYLNLNI